MNPTDTSDQHHCHGEQGKGSQGLPHANGSIANGTPLTNGIGGIGNVSTAPGGALGGTFGSLGGTPTKPAAPLDTSSSLFTYTPFGSTPATTTTTTISKPAEEGGVEGPNKRKSIHESWVNVEWNEVKRNGEGESMSNGSPMKQQPPSRDHPMASVPMAPSEMEREPASRTSHFLGGGMMDSEMKPEMISKPGSLLGMTGSPQKMTMHESLNGKPMTPLKQTGEGSTAPPSVPPTISQSSSKQPEPLHMSTSFGTGRGSDANAFASKPVEPHTPKPTMTMMGGEEKTHSGTTEKQIQTPTTAPTKMETPKASTETPKTAEKPKTAETPKTAEATGTSTSPRAARTPRSKPSTPATPRSSGRQRKTVDRLSPAFVERADTKAIEVPAGSGTKFADIPHIARELSKRKSDFTPLITIHRLVFGRPGEAAKRKGHLRQFNGLAADEDMHKATERLAHHTVDDLKDICVFLNLERSGDRKALSERIAKYLMKPVDLGESKPAPRRTPQKRTRSSPSKKGKAKASRKGSAAADGAQEAEESEEEMEEEEMEETAGRESASEGDEQMIADLAVDHE